MPRKKNTPRTKRMRTMRIVKRRRLSEPETTPEIIENITIEDSDNDTEDENEPEASSDDSEGHLSDLLLKSSEECSMDEEDSRYDFRFMKSVFKRSIFIF